MDLVFDKVFDAREACRPVDTSWSEWFADLPRRPEYAALWSGPPVNGYESAPWRIGGYFLEPVESVVSLRPFDDAHEGTVELEGVGEPIPYVFFEFEKIARMMLHDSGLAFEILASPGRLSASEAVEEGDEARNLVRRATSRGLLGHYRDRTRGGLDDLRSGRDLSVGAARRLLRELATGAALQQGRVSLGLDAPDPLDEADVVGELVGAEATDPVVPYRDDLLELCDRLAGALREEASSALPLQPDAYDAIDERLVDRRLTDV